MAADRPLAGPDFARFLELVGPGRRFVLTTHVHPDGDGLGSEAALAALLRARGATVRIVNRDPVPALLAFLDPAREFETYEAGRHDAAIRDADVVVMLDNSDPQRLEDMEPAVRAARGTRVTIDHHPDPSGFWDMLLVNTAACCTGMVVYDLVRAAGWEYGAEVASALFTALSSDTGRFRFANTTADAFRMGADLVAAGASPAQLYALRSENLSLGFLRVFGHLVHGMTVHADGRLVELRVPAGLLESYDAAGEDLAEVINEALKLGSSRVAVLFRTLPNGATKVSLRSKGDLDVNALARRHGGGGHRNASGIVIAAPLEDAAARLLPELIALVRQTG